MRKAAPSVVRGYLCAWIFCADFWSADFSCECSCRTDFMQIFAANGMSESTPRRTHDSLLLRRVLRRFSGALSKMDCQRRFLEAPKKGAFGSYLEARRKI